jgi:hypothetical protein
MLEYVALEPKVCEICGRGFTREVGSTERGCKEHRGQMRPRLVVKDLPTPLTVGAGQDTLRRVKLCLAAELTRHLKNVGIDARAIALAEACELVDKLITGKARDSA